jgi:hypothetical protein
MPTLKEVIASASATRSKDGVAVVRNFVLSDLPGVIDSAQMWNALNYPGVPIQGEAHPNIAGLTAQSADANAIGNMPKAISISVSYSRPSSKNQMPQLGEQPQYSQTSYLVEKQTNFAAGGATAAGRPLLIVRRSAQDQVGQVATVSVLKPVGVIRFRVRQAFNASTQMREYLGTINSNRYRLYDAKTLLCTTINSDSDDGQVTFINSYEFQYDSETWDKSVVYTIDGVPVPNPVEGISIKTYQMYDAVDFSQIGI